MAAEPLRADDVGAMQLSRSPRPPAPAAVAALALPGQGNFFDFGDGHATNAYCECAHDQRRRPLSHLPSSNAYREAAAPLSVQRDDGGDLSLPDVQH